VAVLVGEQPGAAELIVVVVEGVPGEVDFFEGQAARALDEEVDLVLEDR
jgi:hypothetical protein